MPIRATNELVLRIESWQGQQSLAAEQVDGTERNVASGLSSATTIELPLVQITRRFVCKAPFTSMGNLVRFASWEIRAMTHS